MTDTIIIPALDAPDHSSLEFMAVAQMIRLGRYEKPRIRRIYGDWGCFGHGCAGIGQTPLHAFRWWVWHRIRCEPDRDNC